MEGSNTKMSEEWIESLYNTKEGRGIIDRAKLFINKRNDNKFGEIIGGKFVPYNELAGRQLDDQIKKILYSGGDFEKLGGES